MYCLLITHASKRIENEGARTTVNRRTIEKNEMYHTWIGRAVGHAEMLNYLFPISSLFARRHAATSILSVMEDYKRFLLPPSHTQEWLSLSIPNSIDRSPLFYFDSISNSAENTVYRPLTVSFFPPPPPSNSDTDACMSHVMSLDYAMRRLNDESISFWREATPHSHSRIRISLYWANNICYLLFRTCVCACVSFMVM